MKILLLSYHFPELNVIASQRAAAFAKHLPTMGHEVTVITLDWEVLAPNVHGVVQGEGFRQATYGAATVHYLKTPKAIEDTWPGKMGIIRNWAQGNFEGNAGKAYYALFRNHMRSLLQREKHDLLMGVFSPHHHLKLCYELHQEFGISYHLDFRDLWSNRIAMEGYSPSPVEKVQDAFIRKHWKKWLDSAERFSITSEPWRNYLNQFTSTEGVVVRNGFEPDEFEEVPPVAFDRFTVAYTGSIYLSQRLELFLEGFALFCEKHPTAQVLFLGSEVASKGGDPTARHTDLHALVSAYLDEQNFTITPRQPREQALGTMLGANVLLFCAIAELSGWYSGKFLEYLGSGTPILLCPPDHDVLIEAISQTKSGFIASTPKDVVSQLNRIKDGDIPQQDENAVKAYSREAQIRECFL